jgi:hypothetical protein
VKAHHHLAVHNVDGVVAECDQFNRVPFAGGLFVATASVAVTVAVHQFDCLIIGR